MKKKSKKNFKLNLPKDCRFVLLGSGFHLCYLADILVKKKFLKPIIITHPKKYHERDKFLLKNKKIYRNVFEIAKKHKIKIIETNNCNNKNIIKLFTKKKYLAFSLSCRTILNKFFISNFIKVFNIHPSILPNEKGGGTFSWRILNNSKEVSATIHLINEKIDDGDILLQKKTILNNQNLLPLDYLIKTNNIYKLLIEKFVNMIIKNKKFKPKKQNKKDSYYLPRLNTEQNGAINWSWDIVHIERFIRAFDNPYPGAHTFINKKKVIIKNAKIKKKLKNIHPFCYGRVINSLNNHYEVLCKGGILKIKKMKKHKIKVSDIFYTPENLLINSKRRINIRKFSQKIK